VLVTGGASFIGSHLVNRLLEKGAFLRIADNFSSGKPENIQSHLDRGEVELIPGDLLDKKIMEQAVKGVQVVFHLAALQTDESSGGNLS